MPARRFKPAAAVIAAVRSGFESGIRSSAVSVTRPSFPPDVAAALQRPVGEVSVRYTVPERLRRPFEPRALLMETPYEDVLAAITLGPTFKLRFVRTGSRTEGARVAVVDVSALRDARHWDITMRWDAERIEVAVRDQHDLKGPVLTGRWPRVDATEHDPEEL
jgi:hypothetical protein